MVRMGFLFCALFVPQVTFGAVYISEVAWMGDVESASNEWIEIHGNESVEGWVLEAEDGTPSIELTGTLSGARVLYRGSEYTGALENGGEVLVLTNADGVEVDRVEGGDGWSIGGDNESKETLQKIGGLWKTAAATPEAVEDEVETESSSSFVRVSPELSIVFPEEVSAVVGVPQVFSAHVRSSVGHEYRDAEVFWNFGDGTTKKGSGIYHTYEYAGTYVGFVRGVYGFDEVEKRFQVEVGEHNVSFSVVDKEVFRIENTGAEELDLSGWKIVGAQEFVFPEKTIVLSQGVLHIASTVTGFMFSSGTELVLPDGSGIVQEEEIVPKKEEKIVYVSVPVEEEEITEEVYEAAPAAAIVADAKAGISSWVYVWFVVLAGVGGVLVYVRRYT